jgi:hypothetical protein
MEAGKLNAGSFASKLQFVINETVKDDSGKNKYKEIAKVDMPFPVLADFGIIATQSKNDKGELEFDEGVPVYEDDVMDWLQTAVVQQLKAQNRNKFIDGKLKDNAILPENFIQMVAVGERSGEALKARYAAKASFAAYLKSKNKKDTVVNLLSNLFIDANSIATAKDDFANALAQHMQTWVSALAETDKVRFARTIEKAVTAVNDRNVSLDDLS